MARLKSRALQFDDSGARRRQAVPDFPQRNQALFLAALLAFAAPAARAAPLTDATGRTQDVAEPVTTVLPAGAPAQVLLQSIAPEKLGALVEGFGPDHAMYVEGRVVGLPQIAMLTRSAAPGDVAAAAALKPGLVVDYGSLSPRYVAADEKIAQELKVPAVLFSGDLADVPSVVRALAKPLGAEARGEMVAGKAQEVLDKLKPLAALPDAERVPIYVARGTDGLNALRAGTSFDEPLRLAGARNVVAGGGGTFRRMSVDEVVALKPAVVVIGELDVLSSPLHAALPKETKWVLDAGEPYKALIGPPSLNRLVGAAALASVLHPDKAPYDQETVKQLEATLFPVPPGLSLPSPLQLRQ